jgi:hypothetical protein
MGRRFKNDGERRDSAIRRLEIASVPQSNGCIIFTGNAGHSGYGQIGGNPRPMSAHRLAYEVRHGVRLTPDQIICHVCDVRVCVNPEHMFVGTRGDNCRDMARKGRAAKGENHSQAKLTNEKVLQIRADPRNHSQTALAFGVTRTAISAIRNRKLWGHI